ncbi:hypothetical protein HY419_01030 [candidate division WWE3 bacterium]|nr:hypothetical protein [candidate division WWE3 bacterium]
MRKRSSATRKKSPSNKVKREWKEVRLHHRIIFTLIGAVGVVLFWRGTWGIFDATPFINHPLASVVLGLILVTIAGFFFKLS